MRFTSGGAWNTVPQNGTLTLSGYYQYGKDSSGKKIAAYYLQPEIKYSGIKNYTFRLGMEYLSGHDATQPVTKDNNFVPLYGVAHRFMGNLDIFTTFPADVNNAGLVNPYLFCGIRKTNYCCVAKTTCFIRRVILFQTAQPSINILDLKTTGASITKPIALLI